MSAALATAPARLLAAQAFSRAAGAPLVDGNAVELLHDAAAHFEAWLAAIRGAQRCVLLENYIVRDDAVGREFRDALAERARAGVRVAVIRDWLGCLGQSRASFWQPLLAAGGEVRVYNPPHAASPFGWISRDHRKLLVVDGRVGFVSGVCLSAKWLGNPARGVAPWRDTGVAIRGPAVAELERAFAEIWAGLGPPLPPAPASAVPPAGGIALRVIATQPSTAGMLRLDQLIAAMARRTLWLTDAYFVGVASYVQALAAAARDGVDVRLLVPGASDVPVVAALSRAGYRPLLEAGVRVFEWNGSMLHAKTAVADEQWARVGSTNLNAASWMGNCELDVAVEDAGFAAALAAQYERDLGNATEVVLSARRRPRRTLPAPRRPHRASGSSSRAAASAMRFANAVGAALADRRELGAAEAGPLLGAATLLCALAIVFALWPRVLAWPLAVLALWLAIGLAARSRALRRRARREGEPRGPC
ncbi:phosphatidylserine/phosphatidylglycerophosphate/cardiolipin synthase [Mizugakiibacter sediminis]|uniref:Phosphatidylserine/phosphatidylglycerophosphate/ cardiolipin synthase n=2 Tax=Mizugakiibacter sediminis TaxID=1475481 RepID=A0A0K8QJ68_9GAMM|nr:phospholipase D-like domain-containing protein [Mizugakiibacter sediminis]GAP64731.1 phosphatidylserine/phosphatidylglycerophosphate/cardiolipin synthase [Mizugakiibacter sediminis]